MRAIQYVKHGGPEVLEYKTVPDPEAGHGRVVVELRAAAINHLDIHFRRGIPTLPTPLPHIPGCDGAGVIAAVGPGVTHVKPGDRVVIFCGVACGTCEDCGHGNNTFCSRFYLLGRETDGTYAERMAVPARNVYPVPDHVGFDVAAAAPLVYTTAWAMVIKAGLRPGQTVMVMSAGSGMGTALLQLAKLFGATVFATASSAAKGEQARQLGADGVFDHSRQEIDKEVRAITGNRGVDVVFDHVGGDQWPRIMRSLRPGGTVVTCGATSGAAPPEDLTRIYYKQLRVLGSSLGTAGEFTDVMKLVYAGKLRPVIDSSFPLSQAADAHRKIEDRKTFGKVILVPDSP
jgi:NADPH:quinone reductase-like Zn-dependent oxidoreductase